MAAFTLERSVETADLDALNHMNNVRYLSWVQDIARDHWHKLSDGRWDDDFIWVVRNHNINYKRSALAGDLIRLETFVKDAKGPLSTRNVKFLNHSSGKVLAECDTVWCLLDSKTQKPVAIPPEMAGVLLS
jgi:acyl-CoA thioester hydrolase